MKIGIISDSHILTYENCKLPDWIKKAFKDVSMIIHAGDVEHLGFLESLKKLAHVYSVRGNCDSSMLKTPEVISIDIGCGFLVAAHKAEIARMSINEHSRVMVYGHTHISLINEEDQLLVINPGSPTFPRGGLPASVAVLTVDKNKLSAKLRTHP